MTESKADIVQNFYAINSLGEVFDHKHFIADLAVWTEVDVWILTTGRTHIIQLDFFQRTLTGGCLFGFGSVGTESGNKFLQLFDFFLFLFVGFFHLFDKKLAGFKPEIIVSGIQLDLAIVNIGSMCADLIKKITVMGYNDDSIVKVDQKFFEPFDCRKIQMVGRLIEKKNVRIAEQSLCKKNFDFLAAGQVSHLCIVELGFDAKSVQKSSSIRLCLPSVHLCEFTLKFAGTDTVFICKIFLCIDRLFFLHDFIKSGISHDNGIQYVEGIIFEVVLLQEGESLARSDHNISIGRFELPGKDFKESRFTGTVCSDQTVAVAFGKFDVDILKEGFFANT